MIDCSAIQFCVHEVSEWIVNDRGQQSLQINHGERNLEVEQLQALFQVAAFWAQNRRSEDLIVAITNSKPVVTVWEGDRLIGFARATSDGVYRATIWDVVIHPNYQGAGLGRKLVETILMHPHMNRVERTYLMTTHQQQFYERIGFQVNSTTTMVLYNRPPVGLPTLETADVLATLSDQA
ncbi:MAG: GNAT family N-acetyltransferase [Cyanobacteria bacterium]|nr:GNAT family N-acetyltransferase [Cyanobacteriota bacterium]MDW8200762.1 GNAT family N-acetyltransferase [Cyanobacteriota bacterium SKYGB_h_bin112]